ncbi:NAD(P)H-binding protein [Kineosporia mesophila]|uniref:NAD(P)H-binding protein n=1 Tax=Kineosporia mesophila TaxID=566012 RepID=A0ABP6Z8X3_9ACTN|nr:NmrA family NAD(P)-binding protein [Kineosporia mesophila]MCD5353017.1 NmrA family NAD(P)-binding protein [Kineosporia mesophila]
MPTAPVLVTGATGRQGGATARALLDRGAPVRVLVRNPATARHLKDAGAEVVTGDLLDRDSIVRAARGARAVFSVQMPAVREGQFDFADERAQAVNLVEAARAAGVPRFVQTTVTGTPGRRELQELREGPWAPLAPYYESKSLIEDAVREAGFERWTILRPGTFMENFLPSAAYLFPRGVEGGIVTVLKPATMISLVAVPDVGTAAAAALTGDERFDRLELELASDYLSMTDIAEVLSRVLDRPLPAPDLTPEQALAAGMPAYATVPHEHMNVVGQPARPAYARELGLPLTSFETWAQATLRP